METITIDLYESAKLRLLLMKLNKAQRKDNKPEFTLEQFVSMILAMPQFLEMLDMLNEIPLDEK